MIALLNNQTSNVTGDPVTLSACKFEGPYRTVIVSGTFDGATVKVQVKGRVGEWVDLEDATFTAPTAIVTPLSQDVRVRAVVSSAGASTDITLEIG